MFHIIVIIRREQVKHNLVRVADNRGVKTDIKISVINGPQPAQIFWFDKIRHGLYRIAIDDQGGVAAHFNFARAAAEIFRVIGVIGISVLQRVGFQITGGALDVEARAFE